MADTPQTLALITAALAQMYRPRIVKQINRRSVLLRILPIRRGAGKNVAWDVEEDGAFAENFSDGAAVADYGSDNLAPATIPWGLLRANWRITDLAKAAARTTGNPADIVSLFARNLNSASSKLTKRINGQLYTGTGASNQLAGFKQVVIRDDNTYAGIDRTDSANAYFRGNVIDLGGAGLTLARARNAIGDTIYSASGEQPTIGMAPPTVFNYLGSLFQEQRRYTDTVRVLNTPRGEIKLDASIGTIEIEGCTIIKDVDAPASEIQLINPEYCAVEYLPQTDDSEMADEVMEASAQDGYGPIPLGFVIKKLAVQGASSPYSMQAFLQLACERPNALGRIANFTMP